MKKIDIHNYEAYLLDFSEGNLTGELQVELELFLIQHPELDINLFELNFVPLNTEVLTFSNKNNLKKAATDLISENQFIAYIENQLSKSERLELEKSCAINPSLSKEFVLYTNTIAVADNSILFENKQSLKRKSKVIWFNFSTVKYAAAACILFLIGLFMFWSKTNINSETSILADKTDILIIDTLAANTDKNIKPTANLTNLITPDKSNSSSVKHSSFKKTQQPLLADNNATQQNNRSSIKDTLRPIIKNSTVIESPKKETLIAANTIAIAKQKTVVQVITENDDEAIAVNTNKKKTGFWAVASKVLKKLNHAGVKTVNGGEEVFKENTAYAITLGDLNISHKAGL